MISHHSSFEKLLRFSALTAVVLCIALTTAGAQKFSAWVNAGEKAMDRGDYYSALQYFEKALAFETGDVRLSYRTAEASRLFNDYYPAAYHYNQVVLNDREDRYPQALYWLAMMNKMQGEYEPAKNLFYRYYTRHASDSDYYSIRAGQEVAACEAAYQLMKDTLAVKIRNLGEGVNTVYSDFGAYAAADTAVYFSSLRFAVEEEGSGQPERYVTRLLAARKKNNRYATALPLDALFNIDSLHTANAAFSANFEVMVFARCSPVDYSSYRCRLFISFNRKGSWSAPVALNDSINRPGSTSTQPAVAMRGAEGYTLYFASDRPGGYGKLDIYRADFSTTGEFSPPENLGAAINSNEDDMTPYFHNGSQTLYFSSDRPEGLGGYDIFGSAWSEGAFRPPVNAGYPLNTSYHDLYYTQREGEKQGLLASNRPGSLYIKAKTCCYDIYAWQDERPAVADTPAAPAEPAAPIVVARKLLPLVLYFHNDEPDPRTLRTETESDYKRLYEAYMALRPEYEANYTAGLEGERREAARTAIDRLFDERIKGGYERLDRFAGLLLAELRDGKRVRITVRGQASPLAKPDYNVNLSKRRISSFLNYLMQYENGEVQKFAAGGMLVIEEVGAGESLARENVSDDFSDQRNSVYSPAAALERRIELIGVQSEPAQ
jgi:hypothetical protein